MTQGGDGSAHLPSKSDSDLNDQTSKKNYTNRFENELRNEFKSESKMILKMVL